MLVVQSKKLSNLDPEETIVARCANVAKWNHACDVSEYETVFLILLTKLLPVWQEPATIEIKVQTSLRNSNEKAQKAEDNSRANVNNWYHVNFPEILKPVTELRTIFFFVK